MEIGLNITAAVGEHVSGVGYHILALLRAIKNEHKIRFHLFFRCGHPSDFTRARNRFGGNRRWLLHPVPFPHTSRGALERVYEDMWLPRWVRRYPCSLFHGPAHHLPKVSHIPTVVTIHDLAFFRFDLYPAPFARALRERVRASVALADAVIAVSKHTAEEIRLLLGRTDSVEVIYGAGNYATEDTRRPTPEDNSLLRQIGVRRPYALYVGDFGARKNIPYILDAFSLYRSAQPSEDIQLVLVGYCAPAIEALRRQIVTLGLPEESVVFPGRVSDETLPVVFRNASVFLLCSLAEGFTLVTLEAMSYGVPVVATRTSSIQEGTGTAARLVPPEAPELLVAAIRQVLSDDAERRRMITAGYCQVEKFSWSRTAEETVRLYERLAER